MVNWLMNDNIPKHSVSFPFDFYNLMKTTLSIFFSLLSMGCLLFLGSCGDDPQTDPSTGMPDDGSVVIPDATIEAPGANWIGSKSEYEIIFEERSSGEIDSSLDVPRLYVRASAKPHSGSITRLHQSRYIEFEGSYENGFLEGVSREWDSSGAFKKMIRAKHGMIMEDEIVAKPEEQVASLPVPVAPSLGNGTVSSDPIFRGTNENLEQWTKVAVEDGVDYLLDKRNGKKVTGGLRILDENGGNSYYSEYKEGRLHGRQDFWHNTGVKSMEAGYADGVKNGLEIWRDENGLKTWEANFVNGKQHGMEISWDANGTITLQRSFLNGELVSPSE
jgi:antitoxin component YwqK of YwqJK toxin-antitoxin module